MGTADIRREVERRTGVGETEPSGVPEAVASFGIG